MEENRYSNRNRNPKTVSKRKSSNVSYRSGQGASGRNSGTRHSENHTAQQSKTNSTRHTAQQGKTNSTRYTTQQGKLNTTRHTAAAGRRTNGSSHQHASPSRSGRQHAASSAGRRPAPDRRSAMDPQYSKVSNHASSRKNNRGRKKKRSMGCGCFPILLLLLLLVLGVILAGCSLMKGAFDQIEKYELDYSNMSVCNYDEKMKQYETIALFGVDNQDNKIYNKGSRTDCIMVASIHKKTKKVKLMSIYRDTYVSIDGKYDKINAAYSYGGPELALSTMNRNLDLNIENFATVNFKALADAVDTLGGITLTVKSEKERQNLNDYIGNMNKINGGHSPKFKKPNDYPFTATFDGNQAVAYARIRYMAGGDHERANHQRLVVEGIIHAVKKQPWKIKKLVDVVLPQCKTSLSTADMTRLSLSLLRYELTASEGYPFDSTDEKYNGIWYGFPLSTYSNTIKAHEYLYGNKDYTPSDELQQISNRIKGITDDLGL